MTTRIPAPHFPCGPGPLEDDLTRAIQHYTTMRQNLRLFSGTSMTRKEWTALTMKINLVDGFLFRLHHIYDLYQETLDTNKPEVAE